MNKLDLTDRITVFVITVGGNTFDDCIDALRAQDTIFKFDIVDSYHPSSAAFQEMSNRCQTPYYVQVDEDMILRPWAIKQMNHVIKHCAKPGEAMLVCPLWDVHLGRWLQGVKMYKHSVMKAYPYHDVISCEVDQLKRMANDGYTFFSAFEVTEEKCFGLHGTDYNDTTAYERYKGLIEKHRIRNTIKWIEDYFQIFHQRLKAEYNHIDFMALCGLIVGSITPTGDICVGKNYREYDRLHGLSQILSDRNSLAAALHSEFADFVRAVMVISEVEFTDIDVAVVATKGRL